jgi:tetratricopeptide (TPR) repeat protein
MGELPRTTDNVIYVAFGARRGRTEPDRRAVPPEPPRRLDGGGADTVAAVYTRADVARIVGVSLRTLRAWERTGLAYPSAKSRSGRRYTFQDLVAVRTTRELVAQGVPVVRVRRALEALRRMLRGAAPTAELRIASDGTRLVARQNGKTFDPVTGQALLDFSVAPVRDDVVRALPVRTSREDARTAYDYFLEGCRLDDDEATRGRAEAAYRKAIALDPSLASAFTNLGTLRLLDGDKRDAEALFARAMAIDPTQSEAPYNLGFLHLEARRYPEAIELLGRALELDPEFADAHFNLAVALEESGRGDDALPHWAAYLALEPEGPYASMARARVRDPG